VAERDLRAYAQKAGYEVVGVWFETASGSKNNRVERKKVMNLAQARKIDGVLVTELTRWGRSTIDLITTLQDLAHWGVSVIATTGLQFDLTTPQGKLIASVCFQCRGSSLFCTDAIASRSEARGLFCTNSSSEFKIICISL
jgi:putative DNA-invertase from lambdoid prophage Rac